MNSKIISVFCFLMLICCNTLLSQQQPLITSEYNHRRYTLIDGLPTNVTECIFQDSRGFIWIGSEHSFVRFDGHTFKKYMPDKSLPINKIEENERGEIVVYGYSFIFVLDVNSDKLREVVNDDKLRYCVERSSGLPTGYTLYNKTNDKTIGLFHFQDDKLTEVFSHTRLNEMNNGQSIYWDRAAHLYYIPTKDNKVYVVNENGEEKKVYSDLYVCRFVKTKNEVLAVGYNGVWKISPLGFELKYKFKEKKTSEEDFNVVADVAGNIIMTTDGSVVRYNNVGELETIIDNVNIPRSLMFDREGNLWFTSRQGVYNFFKMNLITYKVGAQNADIVYSIVPVGQDQVYIATANGKLIHMNNNGYKELNYPLYQGSFPANFSYKSISIGDAIYFTTFEDILEYKNGKFRWLNLPPEPYYTASCHINNNEFAIGGFRSLKIFNNDGTMIREISHFDIDKPTIYTVQTDDKNRLWIGGHKGICVIGEKDSIYYFDEKTMNAEASIKDYTGRIWISCESHIYYTDGDSIKLFMEFPNTVIGNIWYTQDDLLVVSYNAGIKIIDVNTKRVTTIDYTNGFSDSEPSWNTMTEDNAGNIWLGTQSPNIVKFNPSEVIRNNFYRPLLYITSSQYSENNIDMIDLKDNASLKYYQRNFKFSFIGLNYSNPNNVRYQYRLIGFQNQWSQPCAVNEVTFNNLSPGNYEFQLMADAGTLETQTTIISKTFTIHPAFWQTWWFYTLCFIVLLSIVIRLAYSYIDRKNKEKIAALERQKQLYNLQIQSVRLRSIPHFNANVLAGIDYYLMNYSKEEANKYLAMYSSFTNITLSEVDRHARPLEQEIQYIELYLNLEKMRFGEQFNFNLEIDKDVDVNIMIPNMILHTHCENALKHGLRSKQEHGYLCIKATSLIKTNEVMIIVEDNGIGRDEAKRRQTQGTQQGLNILSQQINLYNQMNAEKIRQSFIDLYDADNCAVGTRIEIIIPKNFDYN